MNITEAYKGVRKATVGMSLHDLILTAPMVGVVHEMFWRGNGYCPDMPFRMSMGDLAPFPIQWQRNRDKAE
jgi:hypothetical protein